MSNGSDAVRFAGSVVAAIAKPLTTPSDASPMTTSASGNSAISVCCTYGARDARFEVADELVWCPQARWTMPLLVPIARSSDRKHDL